MVAISAVAALVSQRWTGVNSPDSEFYASLALHGAQVADRALDVAYLWTRLGYIVPVRALVSAFGPWAGFEIWRITLIVLIVASCYVIVRLLAGRLVAAGLATLTILSSMVLAFVGNTYLTGTVMAALWLIMAAGVWGWARGGWRPAVLAGLTAGWLAMINPYALGLGLALWFAIRIVQVGAGLGARGHGTTVGSTLKDVTRDAVAAIIGAGISFSALWLAGRQIFPGRDWLQTYLNWNDRLDYSVFVSDPWIWLHDSALLVPVLSLAIAVIAIIVTRNDPWAWTALALGLGQAVATTLFMVLMPGPWLEAQHYVAKLWPAALTGIALAVCAIVRQRMLIPRWPLVLGFIVLAIPAMIVAGRWEQPLGGWAIVITVVLVIAFAVVATNVRPARGALTTGMSIALAIAVCAVFIGAQVVQNGRGLIGIYRQYPLRGAFVDYDMAAQMASKFAVQDWLLAQTTQDDRIGLWTDPDRMTAEVAAMQLWGYYNLVSSSEKMSEPEAQALRTLRPTVIAMYAPDRAQIDQFFASLPAWTAPTAPRCTHEPFLGIGTGDVWACVTRLSAIHAPS